MIRDEKGAALPAVLMLMLVIMALSAGVVSLVTAQTKEQDYYENNITALHTAEAGINQYLWSVNKEKSTPIPAETVINYPESNPVAAFILDVITDGASMKVVKSTGWMLNDPAVKRTITVTLNKRLFTQFVYFSDSDDKDIWWTTGDNCYGPYHTNGTLRVDGTANFWGKATYTEGIDNKDNKGIFHEGKDKVVSIDLPKDNAEVAYYGKAADGYYFTGLTRIRLNSNGTFTVINNGVTQTLPLPKNGVIYVDGGSNNNKFDKNNGNVFISGVLNGKLTVGAKNDIYITGYDPTVDDITDAKAKVTNGLTYKDTIITKSIVGGKLILDDNDDDLSEGEGDMLGLVACRNVAVLTKGWFGKNQEEVDSSLRDLRVYAAVMAIKGKFINSIHFDDPSTSSLPKSPQGTLTVRGSIIQQTRGAVGRIGGGGYLKDYAHDPRMAYETPPHFSEPDKSGWEITDWTEG